MKIKATDTHLRKQTFGPLGEEQREVHPATLGFPMQDFACCPNRP